MANESEGLQRYLSSDCRINTNNDLLQELINGCTQGDETKVKALIDLGVNINARDVFGRTPIMYACMNGHLNIVEKLIAHKAIFITARDLKGKTALWFAAVNGHQHCVKRLLDYSSKITPDHRHISPLWIAAIKGYFYKIDNGITKEISKKEQNNKKNLYKFGAHFSEKVSMHRISNKLKENPHVIMNLQKLAYKFPKKDSFDKISNKLGETPNIVMNLHQLAYKHPDFYKTVKEKELVENNVAKNKCQFI